MYICISLCSNNNNNNNNNNNKNSNNNNNNNFDLNKILLDGKNYTKII